MSPKLSQDPRLLAKGLIANIWGIANDSIDEWYALEKTGWGFNEEEVPHTDVGKINRTEHVRNRSSGRGNRFGAYVNSMNLMPAFQALRTPQEAGRFLKENPVSNSGIQNMVVL